MNYYNENDPFAAQWLRELIKAEHISKGEVDERSITDVRASDLRGFTQCHFFAGIGGWAYALRLAEWPDTRSVWTGSCPCQPFSHAGTNGGFSDPRHLWPEWFRLIRECKPSICFGEQVDKALAWLDLVSGDMEGEGYAIGAAIVGAHSVGAPHRRQRMYWVAESEAGRCARQSLRSNRESTQRTEKSGFLVDSAWSNLEWISCQDGKSRPTQPGLFPLAHGIPARMGRLRGYGNAIVPQIAQEFIEAYLESKETT